MGQVTIRQAMQQVADYPAMADDNWLQKPAHELICRALFDIANRPDPNVRGSLGRANRARKMILDRMVGKRRAGTHPAAHGDHQVEFLDLGVGGEIGESAEGVQPPDEGGHESGAADGEPGPDPGAGRDGGDES